MSFVLNLPVNHPFLAFEATETQEDFLVYTMFRALQINGRSLAETMGCEHSVIAVIPKGLILRGDDPDEQEIYEQAKRRLVPAIINHFVDAVNRDSLAAREGYILFDGAGMHWERIAIFLAMIVNKFKPLFKTHMADNDEEIAIKFVPSESKLTDFIGNPQPIINAAIIRINKAELLDMAHKVTEDFDSKRANDLVKSYVFSMITNWFFNPPATVPEPQAKDRFDIRRLINERRSGEAQSLSLSTPQTRAPLGHSEDPGQKQK